MIDNASTDVIWGPATVSTDDSDIDETRARGAYLNGRLPWVLGLSMMGAVAALFGSFLQYAAQ